MKRRVIKPRLPRRPIRRETPMAGIVCAALIAIGAWLIGWWMVPIAALVASAIWYERPTVIRQVTWGAVAAWVVLLLIDSVHGRTWALARAAGGVMFLPWGLLILATLLFAAGLAWSAATLAQAVCLWIAARRSA